MNRFAGMHWLRALSYSATLVASAWTGLAQTPAPAPPAQFPPLGTGISGEEGPALQSWVDELVAKIAALKKKYRSGSMIDRVADVEVFLDAVRRPLKYDERLYAGRGSTPVSYALQTLTTGNARADELTTVHAPWMAESAVRGFYSRI